MNYRLFLFVIFLFRVSVMFSTTQKSPHGAELKINCTTCHKTDGWNRIKENGFNHNKTKFPLVGQHKSIDCKQCHSTLKFNEAKTECSSCHTDIHEGTVGKDCDRCHTPNSWIVTNVRQIHQQQGFPLLGAHAAADCNRCHVSASSLRFENMRTECYSCHQQQYDMTVKPNHKTSGFGIDCQRCHNMVGQSWNSIGKGFDHGFFPLAGAHNIECSSCHIDNDYKVKLSSECSSCHSPGPARDTYPAHDSKYQSYDCSACHNITSWSSGVRFVQHDSWGRIYSGKHKSEWSKCTDCHSNDAAYVANCRKCHSFSTGKLP